MSRRALRWAFSAVLVPLVSVLSGFLVSGLLFREYLRYQKINFPRFFLRRGLKIYPPFLFLIATVIYIQVSNGPVNFLVLLSDVLSGTPMSVGSFYDGGDGVQIAERWIHKFERGRLRALAELKKRLEGETDG